VTAQIFNPGDLNRRLILQAPVESADGEGGVSRTYADVCMLWAQVTPLNGRSDVAADSLGAAIRYAIVIRARADVTTGHIFQDGDVTFRIIAARLTADRRFLEIDAEQRED
jgi:SPP1 family predicted phage head-tail adaptor